MNTAMKHKIKARWKRHRRRYSRACSQHQCISLITFVYCGFGLHHRWASKHANQILLTLNWKTLIPEHTWCIPIANGDSQHGTRLELVWRKTSKNINRMNWRSAAPNLSFAHLLPLHHSSCPCRCDPISLKAIGN